jgi:hypothetical protein
MESLSDGIVTSSVSKSSSQHSEHFEWNFIALHTYLLQASHGASRVRMMDAAWPIFIYKRPKLIQLTHASCTDFKDTVTVQRHIDSPNLLGAICILKILDIQTNLKAISIDSSV